MCDLSVFSQVCLLAVSPVALSTALKFAYRDVLSVVYARTLIPRRQNSFSAGEG